MFVLWFINSVDLVLCISMLFGLWRCVIMLCCGFLFNGCLFRLVVVFGRLILVCLVVSFLSLVVTVALLGGLGCLVVCFCC